MITIIGDSRREIQSKSWDYISKALQENIPKLIINAIINKEEYTCTILILKEITFNFKKK